MKQVSGVFHFSESYYIRGISRQESTVILTVNYRSKTFSVTPQISSNSCFDFSNSSESSKYLAELKAIESAIEFGNQEIGVTPKHECAN